MVPTSTRARLLLGLAALAVVAVSLWIRPPSGLDASLAWESDNRAAIDALLARIAAMPEAVRRRGAVAVFDWDNTVIAHDVGAAMVHHQIRSGLIHRLPGDDWGAIPFLSRAARRRLSQACAPVGEQPMLPTVARPDCADELAHLYERRTLADGTAAFAGYDHRRYKPSAALQVQLLAGYTPAQVRTMATEVVRAALAAPQGAEHAVGRLRLPAWLRIYPQMRDLIGVMQRAGAQVWVVSASPQHVVEVMAAMVGVPPQRVIGIRVVQDPAGRLTLGLQGCGPIADGQGGLLTYIDGKVCWINKAIYGVQGPDALAWGPPANRPLFAAGDTGTDTSMLAYATELRLVIDRHNPALLCHALHQVGGGRWLIQPRFIDPLPPPGAPYPCSTTACVRSDGQRVPCMARGVTLTDR